MKAFDDPAYPWWLQGQMLLLSAPEAAPPHIDRKQLVTLFDDGWASAAQRLSALHVTGVLRPGVDGDVAGLFTLTEHSYEASLAALEREAKTASFLWSVVDEDALLAG